MSDASLAHPRVESMSVAAIGLAILLHAAVGAAIWWLSPLNPPDSQDEPIMVSFDSSPSNVGLQEPERVGPPAESAAASPSPASEPIQQEQQPTPNLPAYEFSIPSVPEPPPAPTSRDFPKPPTAQPPRPVQRTPPMLP